MATVQMKSFSINICHYLPQYDTQCGTGLSIKDFCEASASPQIKYTILTSEQSDANSSDWIRVIKIPNNNRQFGIFNIGMVLKALKTINKPDLLHLHGLFSPKNNLIVKKFPDIPYILTIHGVLNAKSLQRKRLKKRIYFKLFDRHLIKTANHLHVSTLSESQDVLNAIDVNPPFVIPFPLRFPDLCNYPKTGIFRNQLGLSSKHVLSLNIGRFDIYTKGLDTLVEAACIVHSLFPNFIQVFIGYGRDQKKLRSLIRSRNAERFCVIHPAIFGNTKLEALVDADLYCQPSRYESYGLSQLEAIAAGHPRVIASSACALAEELKQSNAAEIIHPDSSSFASAIINSIQRLGINKRIIAKSALWVRSYASPAKVAPMVYSFYFDALNRINH